MTLLRPIEKPQWKGYLAMFSVKPWTWATEDGRTVVLEASYGGWACDAMLVWCVVANVYGVVRLSHAWAPFALLTAATLLVRVGLSAQPRRVRSLFLLFLVLGYSPIANFVINEVSRYGPASGLLSILSFAVVFAAVPNQTVRFGERGSLAFRNHTFERVSPAQLSVTRSGLLSNVILLDLPDQRSLVVLRSLHDLDALLATIQDHLDHVKREC